MTDLATLLKTAQAKGNDSAFRAFIQRQPSCLSGDFGEYLESGAGRNVAAHVRRAGHSGTAFKGSYAVIPLTFAEHLYQHQHSESACLARYLGGKWTLEAAKEFFDEQRLLYLRRWLES